MDLARLVRYKIQRWRCTYPRERPADRSEREKAETLRDARAVPRAVLSVSPPFSLALSLSAVRYGHQRARIHRYLARFDSGGSAGRCLAAHGRRSDLELLSHGVGTFMPHQRGIRDEFNSDWSLSITSSLSGTFSLFARYRNGTRSSASSRS